MPKKPEEITVAEAAILLELTPRAVQLMIQRGDLPARRSQPWRARSPLLIKLSDVQKLMKPDNNITLGITALILAIIVIALPNLL